MGNAVQEREYIAVRCHGGCNCRHCSFEIICLEGQDHRVIDRRHLGRDHCLYCYLCVPELTFDPQPLFGKTLAPPFADKKRNIGSALGEAAAEIATSAARAQH